jgi:DNA polymerase-3 subunit epsilon
MFAVVDIETTGGYCAANSIIEIAIVLHNGKEVEGKYQTLIRPTVSIPPYIQTLTGITNNMVQFAPCFEQVASRIFQLLQNRIFVAHNVNFDYSFVKHHLEKAGYYFSAKKICTLRLSRKIFPNEPRYGLQYLCKSLSIPHFQAHRAGGDAEATAILLERIIQQGGISCIQSFLKPQRHEQILPPNLPVHFIDNLPAQPGVYYFHNQKRTVIYVGKAKSIRKRVLQHFTGHNIGKKRQWLLQQVYEISFTTCPTEFAASILESGEIKRLYPKLNLSQKKWEQLYGIYSYEDRKGYMRLMIDKKKKNVQPLALFHILSEAYRVLRNLIATHQLEPALCFLETSSPNLNETPHIYNQKVKNAIHSLQSQQETFLITEPYAEGISCILIEQGMFYGMGTMNSLENISNIELLKKQLLSFPENEVIKNLIRSYIMRHPTHVVKIEAIN